MNRHVTLFAEYLRFWPSQFLKQSTAGRHIDYWTGGSISGFEEHESDEF